MKEISFFFPPPTERATIVQFVTDATAEIAAAISRLESEIKLLREYRTRLVADVVTGKLDVREAAHNLPDEEMFDEIDASDEAEIADEEIAV